VLILGWPSFLERNSSSLEMCYLGKGYRSKGICCSSILRWGFAGHCGLAFGGGAEPVAAIRC